MSASDALFHKYVVIGGGPTGLGAAWRLNEVKEDWVLLEAATEAGGLASSVRDEQGFLWDLGVHQIFSHYDYFDKIMDTAMKEDEWCKHVRAAYGWMRDRWVPYPVQNNIWLLPEDDVCKVIDGLLDLLNKPQAPAGNFEEWILQKFGRGLADVFMIPYNKKVWAIEPKGMCTEWMGERVAQVDVRRVINNLIHKKIETSWGPNATFRYPIHGGTGAIWKKVADCLPQDHMLYNAQVVRIDSKDKLVHLADGRKIRYENLISTMPLDYLLRTVSDQPAIAPLASQLRWSAVHLCCLGIDGPLPERLEGKYWMYFPEDNTPCFRVTLFSNYSPYNVPNPGKQWSLLCEVSESVDKPVNAETIMDEVVQGCINSKLLEPTHVVVSRWHRRLDHGYPTPFYGRDGVVHEADAVLKSVQIMSRGRFGGWKYEVSNQDHSAMQGVEAVDFLREGREELTFYKADYVNTTRSR